MNKVKGRLLFFLFVLFTLAAIAGGVSYALNNINAESYKFEKDGYALYSNKSNNFKTKVYTFKSGTDYNYKKLNDNITFNSDDGNAKIDESTVIHYADKSLLVLKNVVGLDLSTINQDIIFYYNIYKNNTIKKSSDGYEIETYNKDKINFKDLLLRINESKYLFLGDNIRLTLTNDEVVDFDSYVYFEYVDGNILRVYNNTKTYQTISDGVSIICDDIIINLSDKTIAKDGKKYITLSNLVIDYDGNIDIITETDVAKLPEITQSNIVIKNDGDNNVDNNNGGNNGGSNSSSSSNNSSNGNQEVEQVEDKTKNKQVPVYKVVSMAVTPIQIDSEIEINDEEALITSDTHVTIVDNSTLKEVYSQDAPQGDTNIFVSTAALDPDTEYTMYAKASYSVNEVEYDKTFLSKIFRTEAIGVSMNKNYVNTSSISVLIKKENYSTVSSVTVNIYNNRNERLDYKTVDFTSNNSVEVTFDELDNNSLYTLVMNDIMCDGVIVKDGYSIKDSYKTLKIAPSVGDLNYQVNKKDSYFELSASKVKDPDLGIVGYRYEVFDVFQNMNEDEPLLTLSTDNLRSVKAPIDGVKLERGKTYTYRLVIIFNDNEKVIEYIKELGSNMQMDGVEFPTIRFEKTNVTWEQIKGTIIVDDKYDTIVGTNYRVVYKNSVDSYLTNVITVSTSVESIPININNLRANETYTFQVYADVNLKDGNDTIKEAYIGSVFVQTEKPQTLVGNYESTIDYNSAFSVLTRLTNKDGEDARLEASTLSEITITLYQGSNTSGAKEVSKRVIDLNDDDYESTIKEMFYDQSATINPAFFDANNNDFNEKTYTLELSNARDYTIYKNVIPIENNTFTFTVNSFVPNIPDDPENAISVTEIKNSASDMCDLEYNNDLEAKTLVCYILKANYYNTARNATKMVYHTWIFNQNTNQYEMLSDLDQTVYFNDEDEVGPVKVLLDNGTSYSTFDNDKLRRGNQYYFSYEVYLDIDGDGTAESVYPTIVDSNAVLRSTTLKPRKQSAYYKLYPSTSTNNSASWKYLISDIDHSMESNNLYSFDGNRVNYSSNPAVSISNSYNGVSFTNLTAGNFYSIKSYERLVKTDSPDYKVLATQYLDRLATTLDLKYTVSIDSNSRLVVEIDDYYGGNKEELIEKVASADVKLTATDNSITKTINNCSFDSGKISINLIDITEFRGKEFTVDVTIFYDSGNAGFDVPSNYKALQRVTLDGTGNYYSFNTRNELVQNSIIKGSMFTTEFDPVILLFKVTNTPQTANLTINIDESGVVYKNNNVVLKELKEQQLGVDNVDNKKASFNILIPSISLYTNNKLNITPLLTSVEVNARISKSNDTVIQDNKIYIDLFSTNENGTERTYIRTIEKLLSDFSSPVTIDNLNPKSNYAIQFYTYLYDSGTNSYFKTYLYDEDDTTVGRTYMFSTLADVGIDNVNIEFNAESYSNKKINVTYTLESLFGYDHIEYKVYEKQGNDYVLVNVNIPNAIAFWNNMSFNIDASPGNTGGFAYGKDYKLSIKAVAYYTSGGEQREFELGVNETEFSIPEVEEPQIGISASKTDNSITYKVSVKDNSKVVVDGVYSVKLVDSAYNTITTETNVSIRTINKEFTYDKDTYNLRDDEIYILVVSLDADLTNDGVTFTNINKNKSIRFGNSVSLGSVTASKNSSSNYAIDIIFANSYLLTSIDRITYSVRSSSVNYFSTGSTEFVVSYDPNADIYTYVMNVDNDANFAPGNVYVITMNFYTDGQLVEQEEINYYYRRD